MKFFSFFLAVVFVLSLSVTAFADDVNMEPLDVTLKETEIEGNIEFVEDDTLNMVLNEMQSDINTVESKVEALENEVSVLNESDVISDSPIENVIEEEPEINPDTDLPVDISLMSVAPITPEDSSGLKAVLLSVLGDYDPIVVEYKYQNTNQTSYQYLREVMPDYPWCASFLMLALFVYCIFRLGGALIG